jgi:hypothetical protein
VDARSGIARGPTQSTWRRLIQTLLAYEGQATDLDAVRFYQRDRWGMATDETASIELMALHAPSLSHPSDRTTHRKERVATIRERLRENGPTFIVLYGDYRDDYERMVGGQFDRASYPALFYGAVRRIAAIHLFWANRTSGAGSRCCGGSNPESQELTGFLYA